MLVWPRPEPTGALRYSIDRCSYSDFQIMTENVTVIRAAAWAVVWDDVAQAHTYVQNVDIAFSSKRIRSLGPRYDGRVAREILGHSLMVMPGLVNTHCHSGDEPIAKGLFEDVGTEALWG